LNILTDTVAADQLTENQQRWLAILVKYVTKALFIPIPEGIFNTLFARGWVSGTPQGCKLNGVGLQAAGRILPDPKAKKKSTWKLPTYP
jgi:hypothetical protein